MNSGNGANLHAQRIARPVQVVNDGSNPYWWLRSSFLRCLMKPLLKGKLLDSPVKLGKGAQVCQKYTPGRAFLLESSVSKLPATRMTKQECLMTGKLPIIESQVHSLVFFSPSADIRPKPWAPHGLSNRGDISDMEWMERNFQENDGKQMALHPASPCIPRVADLVQTMNLQRDVLWWYLWPAACLSDLPWPCFCLLRLASQLNLVRQTFISPFWSVVCMPFPGSAHDHDKVEVYFQFACRKLAWLALASLECGTTLTCQQFFARVGLDTWIIGHQTSSHIYDILS